MADVWSRMPEGAALGPAIALGLERHAPDVVASTPSATPAGSARPSAAEPWQWSLTKWAAQVAVVVAALVVALDAGRAPLTAAAAVGTALLLMLCVALTDRERFAVAAGFDPSVVEVYAPVHEPVPAPAVVVQMRPPTLAEELASLLGEPVEVS